MLTAAYLAASTTFVAPAALQPHSVALRASPIVASASLDRRSVLTGAFAASVFASPLAASAQIESVNVSLPAS